MLDNKVFMAQSGSLYYKNFDDGSFKGGWNVRFPLVQYQITIRVKSNILVGMFL